MQEAYKVFIRDKPFVFVSGGSEWSQAGFLQLKEEFLSNPLHLIENRDFWDCYPGFYIASLKPEIDFGQFAKHFMHIVAAGGMVLNKKANLLMIYRRGYWDLPKGKLDEGENIEDAALREVKEETGLSDLILKGHLADTWHVYYQDQWILKQTAWFEMQCNNLEVLVPQAEEDISEAVWVSPVDIPQKLSQSYSSVREIIEQFLTKKDILA
jgi:ADP-ribose pyrophosphatase YjhB (NUDIX family)